MPKTGTGPSRVTRPASKNATKTSNRNASAANGRASTSKPVTASAARPRRPQSGSAPPARTTFRSRHPMLAALIPVGLVVAAIATMVVIKSAGGPAGTANSSHTSAAAAADTGSTSAAGDTTLSPAVLAALSVPASTLDAVGSPSSVTLPSRTGGAAAVARVDGKPLITYVGAEYCPYCAAERWALAVALSRFGNFTGLSGTQSSSADVYPDTQTLSFYGSSYTSPYVDFESVEEAGNQVVDGGYATLQTPTAAQTKLLNKYDRQGNIPFLDIADKYLVSGASYSPQLLQGMSRSQIAAQLNEPSSAVAQAIDGTANDITAAICSVTGNQPSSVCESPAVTAAAKSLAAS
jgi:Domain of unknown function (DUF929)